MSEPEAPPETPAEPEPDPEPEPESEPTPEPEEPQEPAEPPVDVTPPQGASHEEWEERFKKADKAATTYARRIGEIFEEDANQLIPCPLCPGMHKGFVNVHDAGKVPREIVNDAMRYLGQAFEVEYKESPTHRPCGVCDGYGQVSTGSRVPGNEKIRCSSCNGYGYTPPPGPGVNGPGNVAGVSQVVAGALADLDHPAIDSMGEPEILPDGRPNPNYGKWPQYKVLVEPWGVTAGLVADTVAAP